MNNLLILVNEEDEEIGYCEKMDAHRKKYLHRAFSLFIYHKADHKMLIHKRALGNIIQVVYGQTHVVRIRDMEKI